MAEYDDNKEECIIVDVDGTLAHISDGRDPYDETRAMNDTLDDAVSIITAMCYDHGYKVIIVTARGERHRKVTEQWLEANGVQYDELYTSKDSYVDLDGNPMRDQDVKEKIFREKIEHIYNVKFVMDDRSALCSMWRGLDLKCLQVEDNP